MVRTVSDYNDLNVLHDTLIGDGISDDGLYRSGLRNTMEAQANQYAADILMPWDLVNRTIRKGVDDIKDLPKTLNVSGSAMSIRLGVPY